jgi:hypothetical protein
MNGGILVDLLCFGVTIGVDIRFREISPKHPIDPVREAP